MIIGSPAAAGYYIILRMVGMGGDRRDNGGKHGNPEARALCREVVETRTIVGISRESLFERLLDVERFPEWGYGLRRVRLRHTSADTPRLKPGARIEFGLRAAGINHQVTSIVTEVEAPGIIEWRYVSGATGSGGWLLEEEDGEAGGLVRMTLSTDYSVQPPWLDRLAHRPFFRNLISDLLSRSLRRLEEDLGRDS